MQFVKILCFSFGPDIHRGQLLFFSGASIQSIVLRKLKEVVKKFFCKFTSEQVYAKVMTCRPRIDLYVNLPDLRKSDNMLLALQEISILTTENSISILRKSVKIGGGGFGVVYRGILRDGTRAAIKILSSESKSKQGTKEFLTEINMISTVLYQNLVQLICSHVEDKNWMLLFKGKGVHLDWPKRVTICMGTASGLVFLDEEANTQIVHHDIKASNILLDENFHEA
ncbi:hypothetical protein POM88_054262 [Heracleum sosnowskyi]|uniref:Protein kinase domain-containing protein n=1 Tax=Heracleum sosnowskyi TaxID=360622 RepID=A0AAD8GMP7_9APIA|nr:hypothetical protein POM88_054262 [Heracleum sosnowskyi]